MTKKKENLRKTLYCAMLAAISYVLIVFVHFSIFPAAPFLEYDPADIPILIGTFAYGPVAGLCITVVVSVLQGITVSSASGIIGILMHILSTGSLVLVSGFIYKKHHTMKGAVAALGFGSLAMVIVMTGWNLLITPKFMGAPMEAVLSLMLPAIIPFNVIKAVANSIVTFLLYKRVRHILFPETRKNKISKVEKGEEEAITQPSEYSFAENTKE